MSLKKYEANINKINKEKLLEKYKESLYVTDVEFRFNESNKKLNILYTSIDKINTEVINLQDIETEINKQINDIESQINENVNQRNFIKEKITKAEMTYTKLDKSITFNFKQYTQYIPGTGIVEELIELAEGVSEAKIRITNEIEWLKQEYSSLFIKLNNLHDINNSLKQKLDETKQSLKSYSSKYIELNVQRDSEKKSQQEFTDQYAKINKKITEFVTILNEL